MAAARAYGDRAELRTTPIDTTAHPLVTEGSVIVEGVAFPAVEGTVPIVLIPGYEYRLREFQANLDDTDDNPDGRWLIERRKV